MDFEKKTGPRKEIKVRALGGTRLEKATNPHVGFLPVQRRSDSRSGKRDETLEKKFSSYKTETSFRGKKLWHFDLLILTKKKILPTINILFCFS